MVCAAERSWDLKYRGIKGDEDEGENDGSLFGREIPSESAPNFANGEKDLIKCVSVRSIFTLLIFFVNVNTKEAKKFLHDFSIECI